MILDELTVSAAELESRTGWAVKPEGLCKGEVCVPAPEAVLDDGRLDVSVAAEKLGMPIVHDEGSGIYAVGPEGLGHSLTTATAPELELPTVDGDPFALSSLRGRKVLLVAWASW